MTPGALQNMSILQPTAATTTTAALAAERVRPK
jgi:hypothetical protein